MVVVGLIALLWVSLWLVYDYRSPVRQFLTGVGTVPFDGWSAWDLNMQCVRLETASGTPATSAEAAGQAALKAYPGGYIREILLVTYSNTCTGGHSRLAWAVSMTWAPPSDNPLPTGPKPRAVVVVDAASGRVVTGHSQYAPSFSPGPT